MRNTLVDIYENMYNPKTQPIVEKRTTLEEQYMLSISDLGNNNEIVYQAEIDKENLKPITKSVDSNQKIVVGNKKYTVPEIIDMCLKIDKWDERNSKYDVEILQPILNAFNSVDLNRERFGNLISIQTDQNNPVRNLLLTSPGQVFNYIEDLIPEKVWELFTDRSEAMKVIEAIWNRDTKVSGISVGKGEIIIALFSDGLKGEKGDLNYPGLGEVELKGSGARMGASDSYSLVETPKSLNKILSNREIQISDYELQEIKERVITEIQKFVNSRTKEDVSTYATELEHLITQVSTETDIDSIIKDIQDTKINVAQGKKNNVIKWLTKYKKHSEEIKTRDLTFREAILAFFGGNYQLTPEELAEGLFECRNYKSNHIAEELKQGCLHIAANHDLSGKVGPYSNTARAVAALHTVCYQHKEKFPYIVFMNDASKNMAAIDYPDGESASDALVRTFDYLVSLNAQINLSVDNYFKSTGITIA